MVDAVRPRRQVSALELQPCLAASAGRPIAALVDGMLAMYVDWRESTDAVADTYGRWCVAPAVQEPPRLAAYLPGLDQEQTAAAV